MIRSKSAVLNLILIVWYLLLSKPNLIEAGKESANIVLHGGKHGCCHHGGGALIWEHGKGKKHEKLIIKDDKLIMQGGNSGGNLIMDGSNLIMKEGKKDGNLIIKGGGGGHCEHHEHHEEHVSHPMPIHIKHHHTKERRIYVPVPVHHKKKVVHHHHTKEVHHHDHEGGYHRKDSEPQENLQFLRKKGRLFSAKATVVPKLKVGQRLNEDEKAKLKRHDASKKRLGGLASHMLRRLTRLRSAAKSNGHKNDAESSVIDNDTSNGEMQTSGHAYDENNEYNNGNDGHANSQSESESNASNESSETNGGEEDTDNADDFFSMIAPFSSFGYNSLGSSFPGYSIGAPFDDAPKYSPRSKLYGSKADHSKLTDYEYQINKERITSSNHDNHQLKHKSLTVQNRAHTGDSLSTTTPTSMTSTSTKEPLTSESIVQPVFTPDERFGPLTATVNPPINLLPNTAINFRPPFAAASMLPAASIPFSSISPTPISSHLQTHSPLIGTLTPPPLSTALLPPSNPIDNVAGMLLLATQVQNRMLQQQLMQNQHLMHQQQLLIQQSNHTKNLNEKYNLNSEHEDEIHSSRSKLTTPKGRTFRYYRRPGYRYRKRSRPYHSYIARPSYSHRPRTYYKSWHSNQYPRYNSEDAHSDDNHSDDNHSEESHSSSSSSEETTKSPDPLPTSTPDYWDKVIANTPDFIDTLMPKNVDTIDDDTIKEIMGNTLLLKRRLAVAGPNDSSIRLRLKHKINFDQSNIEARENLKNTKFKDFLDDFEDLPKSDKHVRFVDTDKFEQLAGSDNHKSITDQNQDKIQDNINNDEKRKKQQIFVPAFGNVEINQVRLSNNAVVKSYHTN